MFLSACDGVRCVRCPDGEFTDDDVLCTECPIGTYSGGGAPSCIKGTHPSRFKKIMFVFIIYSYSTTINRNIVFINFNT